MSSSVLETYIKPFIEGAMNPSPTVLAIGLLFLLVGPIILHLLYTSVTPYTTLPSVLLVGPSGSGKTALVTLFERGPASPDHPEPAPTHTSSSPSSTELSISPSHTYKTDLDSAAATSTKKFLLIDTPGHPKLRSSAVLAQLRSPEASIKVPHSGEKAPLRAVVFLLDASTLSSDDLLPQTASYLYDVLLSLQNRFHSRKGSRAPASVPVLIAANKMDLFTALPASLVKSSLEAELGRIRSARSKGLLDSGVGQDDITEDKDDGWLGGDGSEKFKFEQMMEFDVEVEIIGGNVIGDGPGVDKWWKWLGERV
ncbi:signal recognition particle receptor beta subunit-domain-containing protein [Cladorrhinum samala]|uniref:Signal recognition particle receptor subunit beta n=1 Tax=Cladorrhinum samala TaxID=585594 RepID=A0AAV9HT84_9PEZI|nr:signal recognition particle receptor beta subunit-domain-containing protein [Cladorrhinum samala]